MNMEAKMVEFRSGKTYIDNSYMNIPVTDKLIVDFIHDYILEIINKYNGEFPSGISIQHFNRTIKSIFKKLDLMK